ncbi:hypothetical protein [Acinetobacter sp. Marseille-Q1618]|uniref:hypothetical protein n=1 Tax=Acinetobacter sp. Marseille-Q1618 TaxID=2697502 RepID=UPI00156F021D|nr:hypothetical protein [Acinetobacter sp. Marseille-Q1618]
MKALFISGFLSFALWGCHSTVTQPKAKFEEPEREQCYQKCLGSYKGNAEGARNKCFRIASKYKEGRSCFGGHGI